MKVINEWDAPAAGPWRTDVENCPLKQEVLMRRPDGMHYVAVWNAPPVFDRERHPNAPIAFATINPPEITNDHP